MSSTERSSCHQAASSRGSEACTAGCAWSWPTTRRCAAAPTTRSPSRSICARRRSRRRTGCPASTSSTRAGPTCHAKRTSSPTESTSAASSSTKRACRPPPSRSWPSSSARARRAARTCLRWRMRMSSCVITAPSSWAAHRSSRRPRAKRSLPRSWVAARCTALSRACATTWPMTNLTRCS